MDALKCVLGHREKALVRSKDNKYVNANDYYKLWSIHEYWGPHKFRNPHNLEERSN